MIARQLLEAAIAGTQGREAQPITDEFAQAIAKRLEQRGVAQVPGLPDDEVQRDRLDEYIRLWKEWEAEAEAKRVAQAEAALAPRSTPDLIRQTMTGSSTSIPLNGIGVLRTAPAGLGERGTMNGGNE